MQREDHLVDVVTEYFQVRAAERGGDHGSAAQRRDVDVAGDGDLSQLSGAGDEDDLIFQTFLGEKPGVMSDPDARVGSADGTVSDSNSVGGDNPRTANDG